MISAAFIDLVYLTSNEDTDLRKVYLVHALPGDYLARVDGGVYSREDYYQHPENYVSEFNTKVCLLRSCRQGRTLLMLREPLGRTIPDTPAQRRRMGYWFPPFDVE